MVLEKGLRERLKRLTRPFHREVETAFYPARLLSGALTAPQYRDYLQTLHSVHVAWENSWASFSEWSLLGIPRIEQRFRASHAREDLSILGASPLVTSVAWSPSTFADAIGSAYVLEGSTLGGAILGKKIPQIFEGKPEAACVNYFAGRGESAVPLWAEFCGFLDRVDQERPDLVPSIISGACMAFLSMEKELDVDKTGSISV
jgi:heme oxygenase